MLSLALSIMGVHVPRNVGHLLGVLKLRNVNRCCVQALVMNAWWENMQSTTLLVALLLTLNNLSSLVCSLVLATLLVFLGEVL